MAAAAATPPLMAPSSVFLLALLFNAALMGWAIIRARRANAADGSPGGKPRPHLGVAAAVAIALTLANWFFFREMDRFWPVFLGTWLGAFCAAWMPEEGDGAPALASDLAALSAGLFGLAGLATILSAGVPMANAAIAAFGSGALVALALTLQGAASGLRPAWAVLTLVAGAAAWGDKLLPGMSYGWPLALALGTCLALAWAVAGVVAQQRWLGAVVGAVVYALASSLVLTALYQAPANLLWANLAASVAAAILPLLVIDHPGAARLGRLALLVAGGALLVVDNRLMGILAIAFGCIGLAAGLARTPARMWLGLLVALFAARTWLQVFLDRTDLSSYGVDMTHPYAFAALLAGALMPGAAIALREALSGGDTTSAPEQPRSSAVLAVLTALVLAFAPVLLGYVIHVSALGAWLAGITLATVTMAICSQVERPEPLLLPLLLTNFALTLLAAPWLVTVLDASRTDRATLGGMLGVLLAVGGAIAVWLVRPKHPQPAASAPTS